MISSATRNGVKIIVDKLIETYRDQILQLARQRGVNRIKIFGSMARGESTTASDVDFLVEMRDGSSAFALGGLLCDLEDLLGRHVDMTTSNSLHPAIRDKILRESIEL
jgi:predicted nucleotidyltransferase